MTIRESAFDSARRVSAEDIAAQEGLQLRRKGARSWARCPLHGEKTASLCFYPDGSWFCFGCGRGGSAIDFYAALHEVTPLDAARALSQSPFLPRKLFHAKSSPPPLAFLGGKDEDGFSWDRLCDILLRANAVMAEENADTKRFWDALAARAEAETRLDNTLAAEEVNLWRERE